MNPRYNPWDEIEKPYGELSVLARKRIACISRRHGVQLHAGLSFDEWVDLLPDAIAAYYLI